MSKIRILAIPSDLHGVGKFRILSPYTYIQENYQDDFHIDIKSSVEDDDKEFDSYDIVIFHSFIHNKSPFEKNISRIEWLKSKGIITIIDNDDYWEPDFRHPMHGQIIKSETPRKKVQMLKLADHVTVTTPIFRDTIKSRLGLKNVQVFPNAIDETEPQYRPNPIKSDKIRFGWLGGSSHLYDLELLKNGIGTTYSASKDKVQFVLCGFDLRGTVTEIDSVTNQSKVRNIKPEETVWYQYEKIFTENYNILDQNYKSHLQSFKEEEYDDIDLPYRRRWTLPISKYATNYNHFDVSLAPLVPTMFNSNKSQLKVIEAGFHKKVIIASETDPYTMDIINAVDNGKFNDNGNGLLVNPNRNHRDWGKQMKRIIDNPNMIEDLGNRLYETVKVKYSLKKVSEDRVQFIKSIINK